MLAREPWIPSQHQQRTVMLLLLASGVVLLDWPLNGERIRGHCCKVRTVR